MPFARIHHFYTAGSRNGFEGMRVVCPYTKNMLTLSKIYCCVIETYIEDVRQAETHVPRSAGIDDEASWSCKKKNAANFVQNESSWVQNLRSQGFNFWDSGNPKFSRRRPMPASSPVGFEGKNGLP